jgi:biotin-dependent carboxylase-like uncharacterized protein
VSGCSGELLVTRPGLLTTVQDNGRPGLAHLAIPPSGALDLPALRLANLLVGNSPDAAALETTLTGAAVRTRAACTVAVTGALAPVRVDGRPAEWGAPVYLKAGQVLDVGPAEVGVRSYIAAAGGIAVPASFGSRSTDLLSGLGPAPLAKGMILPLGPITAVAPAVDFAPRPIPPAALTLTASPGPRHDWLADEGLRSLAAQRWTVSTLSNRIAVRLDGPSLRLARPGELPSEGIVTGAVQVTADGHPLIFLADHPTTGGYPVVAVVEPEHLAGCAQARPGMPVRFLIDTPAPPGDSPDAGVWSIREGET